MKRYQGEIVRWAVIAVCGGYGTWELCYGRYGVLWWNGDWPSTLFLFGLHLLIAGPFLAVAYFCLRRQYRKLFLVLGVVGAVVLFGTLLMLPDRLGIGKYFHYNVATIDQMHARPWLPFVALLYHLLSLFGPIVLAAWFYRLCHRWAYRRSDCGAEGRQPAPKTQATGWLVGLGLLCMLSPPMLGMIVSFNRIAASPTATPPPVAAVSAWVGWGVGLCVFGVVLMFLGLVRRRPIPERGERSVPPENA
jgi:hypothetical protein